MTIVKIVKCQSLAHTVYVLLFMRFSGVCAHVRVHVFVCACMRAGGGRHMAGATPLSFFLLITNRDIRTYNTHTQYVHITHMYI